MTYSIEIVKIEIMHGGVDGEVAAQVEAFDHSCATVEMKVATSVDDWEELSRAVAQSLLLMQLSVAT
jgi:hypothetical protein